MAYVAGPYDLLIKCVASAGDSAYATLGCTIDGIMLEDGNWKAEEVKCDAGGESTLDYIMQGKDVFIEFTAGELNHTAIDKLLALHAPATTEPGCINGLGYLASTRAFSLYAAPLSGSLGAGKTLKYLCFNANLVIAPGYANRIALNRNRALIPFRFQALPTTRTVSASSYTSWYYWSATVPT
jgi:hypothetical protein